MKGPEILYIIPVLGGIPITETVRTSFIVMVLVILAGWWMGKDLKTIPDRKQIMVEKGVGMLYDLVESTMGKHNLHMTPYIGALLLSSVCGSLIGTTYVLRSSTGDLSTTLAWAVATTALVWFYSIKNSGILGWLKGFTEPIVVMTPMNLLSEIANPVSMAFRHFGNIAGGMVLTSLIYSGFAFLSGVVLQWIPNAMIQSIPIFQVGIPAFLSLYFDLFTACVQAFIFCMLTMVYVGNANPAPEENA